MCMGCMSNADFLVTGGMVGAAGVRVGVRRLASTPARWARKVTDEEAQEFVASLTGAREPERAGAVDRPSG
jgi:hypothetical protein